MHNNSQSTKRRIRKLWLRLGKDILEAAPLDRLHERHLLHTLNGTMPHYIAPFKLSSISRRYDQLARDLGEASRPLMVVNRSVSGNRISG
ncbi:hypothetical protein HUE56_16625 [Azospirillum oryzae]|uniref:Uncharacterized protein n=1 Tax=Azospirillum oryzae TaxID=286727 RepID=A0A6N1AKJ9_9PROT|nr:hypothetical protein [Azospirillum oryzae]KAA0590762.1 hypothetical protein FZ938_01220 [Azospirillum oryzae]QKS52050.1 hypothetical protein HUE56_16625 [Azospirillum oryzae]